MTRDKERGPGPRRAWPTPYMAGLLAAIGALASALAPLPGLAQGTDIDVIQRETGSARQAGAASQRALDFRAPVDRTVSYDEVLADPDNVELNFLYARSQVRDGDLRGASATLERILLINPDLAQVRLFYAVVLFRLDNMVEAEREFRALETGDIPADVRAEIDRYLDAIAQRQKRTRYTASLSVGGQYDTNRSAAPREKSVLFIDIPLDVAGSENDFAYLVIGSLRVDHDLGFQEGHSVYGQAVLYDDEQVQQDSNDLQSATVEGGGTYKTGFWGVDIQASASLTNLYVSKEKFLKLYGGEIRFVKKFGPTIDIYALTRLSNQTYGIIRESLTAPLRDGRQIEGGVGGGWTYAPTMRVEASYIHFDKNSKAEFFAYDRDEFNLTHTWLLGGGQFLLNTGAFQLDRYNEADPFVSGRTRTDKVFRYRLTYGVPLGSFVPEAWLWDPLEDVVGTAALEYLRSSSNIPNFDYKNLKTQVLFSKTWRF